MERERGRLSKLVYFRGREKTDATKRECLRVLKAIHPMKEEEERNSEIK